MTRQIARFSAVVAALCSVVALAEPGCAAAPGRAPQYRVVHGWPQLPPGENLGQATGVGVDSRGNVLVFHRANQDWAGAGPPTPIAQPTVWVFEGRSGRFLRSWGAGMFLIPHGLTIDRHDNVWLTDTGLHQVFKCSPDGRVLLALGEPRVPGSDPKHFNAPTDVAIAADGSFYVSDGYGNARVMHFAADGAFLAEWGTRGSGPGQFVLPHGVAVDEAGRVYVADRGNERVQVFDRRGTYLAEWRGPGIGRPYGFAMGSKGRVFVVDGGDRPKLPPDRSGVAMLDLTGRLLGRFGRHGNYDGQFRNAHEAAVGPDGAVYVVDIVGQRVQKFVPR